MKKAIAILFLLAYGFMANAQTGEYSSLVIRKATITRSMSSSMEVQIIHYLGGGNQTDYTKTKDGVKLNELIDVLNTLKKAGWKVVNVSGDINLTEDDLKVSLGKVTNATYTEYLLYKE